MATLRPRSRNGVPAGWLALALLVHAALLLLPLAPTRFAAPDAATVFVTLERVRPEPSGGPETQPRPEPAPPPAQRPEAAASDAAGKLQERVQPGQEVPEPLELPAREISLARLLESVHLGRLDNLDTASQRQLGAQGHGERPSYWRKGAPGALPADNLFDGMVAPTQTEIVDRWIEADGSHNVVVNLPNGETLCGRAAAWDPMRPLVEHVMMFRSCGGGGKRTFTMTPRKSQELLEATDG